MRERAVYCINADLLAIDIFQKRCDGAEMSVAREQNKTVNVIAQQSLLIDVVKNNKIGEIFLNAERVAGIDDLV